MSSNGNAVGKENYSFRQFSSSQNRTKALLAAIQSDITALQTADPLEEFFSRLSMQPLNQAKTLWRCKEVHMYAQN